MLRVVAICFLAATAVVAQDDGAAGNQTAATRAAGGGGPQTRFLGIGPLINNLLNPCDRCNPSNQELANRCCQSGDRRCCFALTPGFTGPNNGFSGNFNPGFGGGFRPGGFNQGGFRPGFQGGFQGGFNQGGFRPGGFHQGGFNQGGFNQGGFNQGGFHGGFSGGAGSANTKPGFCPQSGPFGGVIRSGGNTRSGAAGPNTRSAAPAQPNSSNEQPSSRVTRQAPNAQAAPAGDQPQNTRFLNLFGPGPVINNPFCRDECFNDSDCGGNLKCCLRDCRKCTNPTIF